MCVIRQGRVSVMRYEANQISDAGVRQASRLVTEMIQARRGHAGGTDAAIRSIARDCRVTPAQVRRYFQPSRRPKDIGLGLWGRLWAGYVRYLETRIASLEQNLLRLRARGDIDPRACEDLAAEAEALIGRIRQHLP